MALFNLEIVPIELVPIIWMIDEPLGDVPRDHRIRLLLTTLEPVRIERTPHEKREAHCEREQKPTEHEEVPGTKEHRKRPCRP